MKDLLRLPIDNYLPELLAKLRDAGNLVITAEPGAGKTTRVPAALLDADFTQDGEIWVLEPRRLAARLAARRVAAERGVTLGASVGYQVRFEEVAGPATRLRFVTEGVLTRRLLSDATLARVRVVVLDEFHERHLQTDLALAWLRQLQLTTRPDLRLVVMSATLDAAPVAQFLANAPIVSVPGRQFPVTVEHLTRSDEKPLAAQVAAAVRRLHAAHIKGDFLVFLPGANEIKRATEACAEWAQTHDWLVLPLHGELSPAEQDRAVQPAAQRKIILATNVAESSVTIEGVGAVIDSGLARMAGYAAWSGLPTLNVARISQAAATQRAGRAGRTRAGYCLRLYTQADFASRPAHETPELLRTDLTETLLALHAAGFREPHRLPWLAAPPENAMQAAETLLRQLEALDDAGQLTATGRQMAQLPIAPRLARVVCEAAQRGQAAAGCAVAALLSERDLRARHWSDTFADRAATVHGVSDVLELYDLARLVARANFTPDAARRYGLNPHALHGAERTRQQLAKSVETRCVASLGTRRPAETQRIASLPPWPEPDETALLISVLAGFPDRVARRRAQVATQKSGVELLLCGGGAARLDAASVVQKARFVVALDAVESRTPHSNLPIVRLASGIEPDWLLDLWPDAITAEESAQWDATQEKVVLASRLLYGQVVLEESLNAQARGPVVTAKLAEKATAQGWAAFADREEITNWLARVEFVARTFPENNFPALDEHAAEHALQSLCAQRRSFAELRQAVRNGEFFAQLQQNLDAAQLRLLAQAAPERLTLPNGRATRVHYEIGQRPWIASRLQDFFGLQTTPRIAGGRVSVVVHLLAPNQRAVQITDDLSSFWTRHYPDLRRTLSRRYPKHAWPEQV